MGLKKRVDSNQPQVVKELREAGYSVQHLHTVGKGVPDLLVGANGKNYLFELKDGTKPESGRRLTPDEVDWHFKWKGQVHIALTSEQIIRIISNDERHQPS